MTRAQHIAARFHDDGSTHWTSILPGEEPTRGTDEIDLGTIARAAGAREEWGEGEDSDSARYTFHDGSVITSAHGNAWDFGYPTCYCWRAVGHTESCRKDTP